MPVNRNDLKWNATVKAYPAVADLQAVESFIRKSEDKTNVGAPNYDHDLYTVPAGKIFVLEFLLAYCAQADPTNVSFRLRKGIVDYTFYYGTYGGAWENHLWTTPIKYNENEIVRIRWIGTLAGTDVNGTLFGYLINKY